MSSSNNSGPIRVALIGLSANAAAGWAAGAHLPYLLSPRGRERYTLVALLNSSVEAARAAIAHFGLPASTRAYGDPVALAADPDIDLVVSSVRAEHKPASLVPALTAGRAVFVEWPLAKDIAEVRELVGHARETGGATTRTAVALQSSWAPSVRKLADVVASDKIGKVVSSEVWASSGMLEGDVAPASLKMFFEGHRGSNMYSIGVGHLLDTVQSVVGEVENLHTQLQIQNPEIKLWDPASNSVTEKVTSDVPDLFLATGTLPASDNVQSGASFLLRYRRSPRFKGDPALVWSINGEKGEVRLVAPLVPSFHTEQSVTIELHELSSGQVEKIEWQWEPWQEELPLQARSIGLLYEAFARGDESGYPSLEHASKLHELLSSALENWQGGPP